jgi:hypothetical protein
LERYAAADPIASAAAEGRRYLPDPCCAICGADDDRSVSQVFEYWLAVAGVNLCGGCCLKAATAFAQKHGGLPEGETPPLRAYVKAPIPRKLSKAVFERDAYRCVTCSSHMDLTCDHVLPESKGGPTSLENLQTMCRPCNSRKGARLA